MIVELRDEACTLWASDWLSFRRKASKVFLGLRFNFPVPGEDEMGESESDGEDDLGVSLANLGGLSILRLFLSFVFTLVAFGPCNYYFDLLLKH